MIRTFISLEIPQDALMQVIKCRDNITGTDRNIKWEPIEKLHVTLKFLGDTDEAIIELLTETLIHIVNRKKQIQLSFGRIGCFYKEKSPKILWIGLEENNDLLEIVKEIEESFVKFGYPKEERKFKPHITLLRFKGHEDTEKILKLTELKLQKINFSADTIHLMKSELNRSGSIYTSLQKIIMNK